MPESMNRKDREDFFRFALSCESVGRIEAASRLAPSLGLSRPLAQFDSDRLLFNVSNGTLDLRTGELRPHRRDDFITKFSPVHYDANAQDEVFRRFMQHATGDDIELETYLQRAAGYTLSGTIGEKCLFIVYSIDTDTGKTCFVTALQAVMGENTA